MKFLNTYTKTVVDLPAHYAELKPNLVPYDEGMEDIDPCADCHCDTEACELEIPEDVLN